MSSVDVIAEIILTDINSRLGHLLTHSALRRLSLTAKSNEEVKKFYLTDWPEVPADELAKKLDEIGWDAALDEAREADMLVVAQAENVSHSSGSLTAKWVCSARAVAHKLGFGPDRYARLFCGDTPQLLDRARAIFEEFGVTPHVHAAGGFKRAQALQEQNQHMKLDLVTFMQVRTCFIDDSVTNFVKANPKSNLIIHGAGFDTRCYRLQLDGVNKYEVDAKGTQDVKKRILQENDVPMDGVTYVSTDFSKESMKDIYQRAGIDLELPTFIVWEGISYYVERGVVEDTLRTVSEIFKCAQIAFDFPTAERVRQFSKNSVVISEPWLFGADPDDMDEIVTSCGLTVIERESTLSGAVRSRLPPNSVCSDIDAFFLAEV